MLPQLRVSFATGVIILHISQNVNTKFKFFEFNFSFSIYSITLKPNGVNAKGLQASKMVLAIKTTSSTSGLHCPYKGLLLAQPLKGAMNCDIALLALHPVNGSKKPSL